MYESFVWEYPENFNLWSRNKEFERNETVFEHQRIVSRLINDLTERTDLLLFHGLGTGKTCSAIKTAESMKTAGIVYNCVILTRGVFLQRQIAAEIIETCMPDTYTPLDPGDTGSRRSRRYIRALKGFYRFYTYGEFVKIVKNMPEKELKEKYNNILFIIDEAHNVRPSDRSDTYKVIQNVMGTLDKRYVLLLTGTPMRDSWREIIPLAGLFGRTVVDPERFDTLNEAALQYIRDLWRGRTSTIIKPTTTANVVYMGRVVPPLQHTVVASLPPMEPIQTRGYIQALETDLNNPENITNRGVYTATVQASLCVDRNGDSGIDMDQSRLVAYVQAGSDLEEKLQRVREHSTIYYVVIRDIFASYQTKKKMFVYNSLVKGSGINLLILLAQACGVRKWRLSGVQGDGPVIASIVGNSETSIDYVTSLLTEYNSVANDNGQSITTIVGSKIIAEGINLKTVRRVHVCTPFWNRSETDQAIGRAIRTQSHETLPEEDRTVDVFMYIGTLSEQNIDQVNDSTDNALFASCGYSIDLYKYVLAERKDLNIKTVERVLAENSLDCTIENTYNNTELARINEPGGRGCFYGECQIQCQGSAGTPVLEPVYDNVYNAWYTSEAVLADIQSRIIRALKRADKNKLSLAGLKEKVAEVYTEQAFWKSIRGLLDNRVVPDGAYVDVVLLVDGDNLQLSRNPFWLTPGLITRFESETSNPEMYPTPFVDTSNELRILMRRGSPAFENGVGELLSTAEIEQLLQNIGSNSDVFPNNRIGDYIFFKNVYQKVNNEWILIPSNDSKFTIAFNERFNDSNASMFYGARSVKDGEFRLKKKSDLPELTTGTRCVLFPRKTLIKILLDLDLEIETPGVPIEEARAELIDNENAVDSNDLIGMDVDQMNRILVLSRIPKSRLCGFISSVFTDVIYTQ